MSDKAVMLSIRPEWCQKIISGEKTVELRKSFPTADQVKTPFKCYVYCTSGAPVLWKDGEKILKGSSNYEWLVHTPDMLNGKVIGEFVCDALYWAVSHPAIFAGHPCYHRVTNESACLTMKQAVDYSKGKNTYGWHISDLVIYDKPKELSEFLKPCIHGEKDISCFACEKSGYSQDMKIECYNRVERAPQSWCYVSVEGAQP